MPKSMQKGRKSDVQPVATDAPDAGEQAPETSCSGTEPDIAPVATPDDAPPASGFASDGAGGEGVETPPPTGSIHMGLEAENFAEKAPSAPEKKSFGPVRLRVARLCPNPGLVVCRPEGPEACAAVAHVCRLVSPAAILVVRLSARLRAAGVRPGNLLDAVPGDTPESPWIAR